MAVYKKGMDADAVSASGDKLVGYKGELDGIVEAVNGAVQTIKSNWGGQDAEQFQSDWNGQRQVVSAAGDKLNEMGRKAKTNAETQKSASGTPSRGHDLWPVRNRRWSLHRGGAATFRCVRARPGGESAGACRCVRRSAP